MDTYGVTTVTTVTSVTGVTTVTNNSDLLPIPMELLQEYRETYQRLQEVPPEKLAPLGEIHWLVPDSGFDAGYVTRKVYSVRLQALYKSSDPQKVRSGLEEMQRKIKEFRG